MSDEMVNRLLATAVELLIEAIDRIEENTDIRTMNVSGNECTIKTEDTHI